MAIEDNASIALIPSGYKSGKLYSVIPDSGNGDFTYSRGSTATRVAASGLIETVASGVPRLDYPLIDGVVQDCPALLLEPQRINIVPYSNDFNQHSITGGSITSDDIVSPDGGVNADTFVEDTNYNYHFIREDVSVSGGTYTMSVFVKGTSRFFSLYPQSAGVAFALFDIASETITKTGGANYVNSDIQNYGNGWYRCILTYTVSTGTSFLHIYLSNNSTSEVPQYTGNGSQISFYGLQLEAGSYATSYIPTSGSTVTRSADVCNGSGTSAEFNDSEGVLFAEIQALVDDGSLRLIQINDGSTVNNMVTLGYNSAFGQLLVQIRSGGGTTNVFTHNITDVTLYNKLGLKYEQNTATLYVNGFEAFSSSITATPIGLSELDFDYNGGFPVYARTKQLMTFKTALTDSELETLTSWDSFNAMAKGQLYTIE